MKRNNSHLEWILKAQDDESSAEVLLKEDGPTNTVCFLSQQAVEKYLKGYLTYKNQKFPKVHQLELLLELCAKIDKEFYKLKEDIFYFKGFYIETR